MIQLRLSITVIGIAFLFCAASCGSARKLSYFSGQQDGQLPSGIKVPETIISSNDLLSITVTSPNANASTQFNLPNGYYSNVVGVGAPAQSVTGYLVSPEGNIQFPVFGTIKVAGLTENQVREKITRLLADSKQLLDPVVIVRYLNFKVTVLGEVANPTVVNVPTQKITLLEALGLAGDITIYGKKDTVLVIREEEGQRVVKRLNLNSSEIFSSPYYYLKSNDIVYVEPTKARVASSSRGAQLAPIILSGLSFAAIVIDRVTRN